MKSKILSVLGIVLAPFISACATDYKDVRDTSPHFKNGVFHNAVARPQKKSFWSFLGMRLTTDWASWPDWIDSEYGVVPAWRVDGNKLSITHINHSTFLIQGCGLNILTDPIYSERASPFSFAGPKRVRNPGIKFEDLPKIDMILISHDHYDHLDLETIETLQKRDQSTVYTGLEVSKHLDDRSRVVELDWWQSTSFDKHNVTFVPVQHFSGRWLNDRNQTLWGGYVLELGGYQIYFGGDSGYADHYKQTYDALGAIDLALLPIGAYAPRDFMKYAHMNPEEAVQAHVDLQAKKSIGMHYGTFQLTAESIDEPKEKLEIAKQKYNLGEDEFSVLEFGKTLMLYDDKLCAFSPDSGNLEESVTKHADGLF